MTAFLLGVGLKNFLASNKSCIFCDKYDISLNKERARNIYSKRDRSFPLKLSGIYEVHKVLVSVAKDIIHLFKFNDIADISFFQHCLI